MSASLRLSPEAARAQVQSAAARGLREGAQLLLERSRARCPVDSGALRASGSLSQDGLSACVSYAAPHAAPVHERYTKFLEGAVNDTSLQAEILSALQAALQF